MAARNIRAAGHHWGMRLDQFRQMQRTDWSEACQPGGHPSVIADRQEEISSQDEEMASLATMANVTLETSGGTVLPVLTGPGRSFWREHLHEGSEPFGWTGRVAACFFAQQEGVAASSAPQQVLTFVIFVWHEPGRGHFGHGMAASG
jgi:hypothetical protein